MQAGVRERPTKNEVVPIGYWETRNLRMAANIRAVLADQPGLRMLVVVGASHRATSKPT